VADVDDGWSVFEPAQRKALRALTDVRSALDRLEAQLVSDARLEGCSWSEIGADLGLTKAGAYRRHAGHDLLAVRRREILAAWRRGEIA
jgi:hypothetical protein